MFDFKNLRFNSKISIARYSPGATEHPVKGRRMLELISLGFGPLIKKTSGASCVVQKIYQKNPKCRKFNSLSISVM